jgi:hypothetical protein
MHSNGALCCLDDPSEAAVFSVMVELIRKRSDSTGICYGFGLKFLDPITLTCVEIYISRQLSI